MKKPILFLALVLLTRWGYAQQTVNQSIQPYVDFLEEPHLSPVDYVMSLFERYDVVVIGERGHAEMTQYDFIRELITSPAFIEKVGHIMTEVGSYNYSADINRILSTKYKSEELFQKALVGVLRECEKQVLWPRTNFWQLFRTVYRQNRMLPKSRHVDITMLTSAWVWPTVGTMTTEQYGVMREANGQQNYDVIMAENAINTLYEIFKGPRKKVLIIQNVPHHLKGYKRWPYSFMSCISARFPGRVANVKLNNIMFCYNLEDDSDFYLPPADGKWDAAFAATGNKPVGFDMTGSPFGGDAFEDYERYLLETMQELTYEDMFDGYIFYNPVSEMYNSTGIPGLVDEEFLPELMRRYALRGFSEQMVLEWYDGDAAGLIDDVSKVHRLPIWDDDSQRVKYDSIVNTYK